MEERETQRTELPGDERLRRKFGTPDIQVSTSIPESIAHFVESADFFFIGTSNQKGECDCSYRCKRKGALTVKILDERTIIFPDYLGNGSFRSLGNVLENSHIGMLFMEFRSGLRIRINGDAEISDNREWLEMFPGSLQTVKVTVREAYKQNQPAKTSGKAG